MATETKIGDLVKLALDTANKVPSPEDKAYVLAHMADVYEAIGDVKSALPLWTAYQPKGEADVWRRYAPSLAEAGDFEGTREAAGHLSESMLGVVQGDLDEFQECKKGSKSTCNDPVDPDSFWDGIWSNVFDFYMDPPLQDYELARRAVRQFKKVEELDWLTDGDLKKLDAAMRTPEKAPGPAERWASFAQELSSAEVIVNLDSFLTGDAKGAPGRLALTA